MEESITTSMTKEKGKAKSSNSKSRGGRVGIEDFALPRRLVRRLARGVLPPNNYIATDALLAISKSATVFISFIADEANQQIQQKNKKTITPVEVISALREQGYENFVDRVEAEVNKHIAIAGDRRKIYRKKAADKAQNTNNNGSTLSVGSGNTNTSVDQPVDSNGNAGTSTLSVLIHQTPNAEGGEGIGLQVRDHEDEEDEADGSEEDPPPAKKARMSTSNATLGGDDETEDEGVGDEDNHEEGLADDDDDDEEEDEDDGEVESDDEEDVGDGGSDDSLEEEGEEEGEEEEIDEAVADIDSD